MLRAEQLSVSYGAHRALEDVSIHVDEGEICVMLGANGAGKSTLLKAIAGLVRPLGGARITMDGTDMFGKASNLVVEAGIALVPEGRGIFGDLSVTENLALGAYGPQARSHRAKMLAEVLDLFPKLAERRGQVARTMSGGEQQMLAIGRALMSNPRILMLDEPSLGLSPLLCKELFKSLRMVGETGVGILLVEQNARQSLAISDRAYLLENGRVTGEGRAAAMLDDAAVQRAYLGGAAAQKADLMSAATQPLAAAPRAVTAADMVDRASQIAREHVEGRRGARSGSAIGTNGHVTAHDFGIQNGEKFIVSSQAEDLSRKAADFVARATSVMSAHVIAVREAAHAAVAGGPGRKNGKKKKRSKKKAKRAK